MTEPDTTEYPPRLGSLRRRVVMTCVTAATWVVGLALYFTAFQGEGPVIYLAAVALLTAATIMSLGVTCAFVIATPFMLRHLDHRSALVALTVLACLAVGFVGFCLAALSLAFGAEAA